MAIERQIPIPQSPTLHAGIAQIDITPPLGIELTGYVARVGTASGVYAPLYAKALVLDNGTTSVALLTVDILGLHLATVQAVRAAIAAATDIPVDHIMIACSHSHSGPATMLLNGCGVVDPAYLAHLQAQLCAVAVEAWAARQLARVGIGQGQVQEGCIIGARPAI
ncbi:MAG: neutral/alkaline non-lysosomal ceramidase N-terminal domain-containing protein [Caldilineaceae bacterium]